MKPTDERDKSGDLPLISVLPSATMKTARELLEELEMHVYFKDEDGHEQKREDRVNEIKDKLTEIQESAKLPGMRFGRLTYSNVPTAARKSLDRMKLVELGVTVDILDAAMVEGKPGSQRRFKVVDL